METPDNFVSVDTGCSHTEVGRWYTLKVTGEVPTPRVGHTATTIPRRREVILVGGASPDALYGEAWRLDVDRLHSSRIELVNDAEFPSRYEHCALLAPSRSNCTDSRIEDSADTRTSEPDRLWVFAGANMDGNLDDLWELEMDPVRFPSSDDHAEVARWSKLACLGTGPSARTMHTSSALLGDKLTLFGGGLQASSPVDDAKVYCLDADTMTWSVRECTGAAPCPRQGHILVGVGDKLLVHGGMASNTFFSDLYVLSSDGRWQNVPQSEQCPGKRAGHGCVVYNKWMYIWGGLGPHGSLTDLWRLDTESLTWEEVSVEGVSPKPRLDFAMSVVCLPQHFLKDSCSRPDTQTSPSALDTIPHSEPNANGSVHVVPETNGDVCLGPEIPFILLHGGMDDLGNIFDDFHIFRLGS